MPTELQVLAATAKDLVLPFWDRQAFGTHPSVEALGHPVTRYSMRADEREWAAVRGWVEKAEADLRQAPDALGLTPTVRLAGELDPARRGERCSIITGVKSDPSEQFLLHARTDPRPQGGAPEVCPGLPPHAGTGSPTGL